ncbi:MAG TPA: universal stress protein [Dokdonella sp.]|uniref:universal stress protein n=1 Tax=Dokdonella sp. TaxID=2291710 RepID=UPI002BA44F75|nr:universal stress protein [Dokdonella sp.]HUD42139.1 universal stress protein [Dokdonella sp.]
MRHVEIVTHLRRYGEDSPAALVGLQLAQRLDAWLLGLHLVPIAPAAFASPDAVALYVRDAEQLCRDAEAHGPWWQARLGAYGVSGEWQVAQGDPVEALCHASRWADLVVVERPILNPDAPTGWGIVSRTVFGAMAPVVVVPDSARIDRVGRQIVVAYNDSREGILALRGALPLLRQAERVEVLVGEPAASPFGLNYLPRFDLRAWLERHGIAASFREFLVSGKDSGPALLDAARAVDADLIVMGAWGHSRIAELVLGGSTRYLFQNSDVPLLVAH